MFDEINLNSFSALPNYYKQKKIINQLKKDLEIEKRKAAFKPISFSRKFDVGKPQNVVIGRIVKISEFRKLFLKGYIPLKMTMFAQNDVAYWSIPFEKLPLWNIFPCLVEGLSDIKEFYQRLALSALKSIIFHWNNEDLLKWIPNLILPLKSCIRTMKCCNISRALIFLTYLIHVHHLAANVLLPYLVTVFRPINFFFRKENFNPCKDEREDTHKSIMTLRNDIWEFFKEFELCCYPNELDAYHKIKLLLPTYESRRYCDIKM